MARLHACAPRGQQGRRLWVHRYDYTVNGLWRPLKPKREKRQPNIPLADMVMLLDLRGIEHRAIRPLSAYDPSSRDLRKRLMGLVEHLFVTYRVPRFLLRACMREEIPFDDLRPMYREWLVTIGQGGSFQKLVKPFMTGKEAHLFLFAPDRNRIHQNVWWAKMKAAGLPDDLIDRLIDRLFTYFRFDDPGERLVETIRFYARYNDQIDMAKLGEITDCLSWKLRNEPEFHMKGRTIGSVTRLTNRWHVEMQKARLDRIIEWPGLQIRDWEFVSGDRLWTVVELRTNRELLYEGRAQKHCVFSYVDRCVAGGSAIFSMRAYPKIAAGCAEAGSVVREATAELTRMTLEVGSNRVIGEIGGLMNRPATLEEVRVLRSWAREKGLLLEQ